MLHRKLTFRRSLCGAKKKRKIDPKRVCAFFSSRKSGGKTLEKTLNYKLQGMFQKMSTCFFFAMSLFLRRSDQG